MPIYSEKKTIYIIRHGETDFNRKNIVQGSGVDTDLNELGENQASKFYNRYKDIPFDRIYISALRRTKQSVIGFIESGIPYESLKELNEISWGVFEGKLQTPEQRAIYWETVNKWNSGDEHAKIAEGESPNQLQKRQKIALDRILQNTNDKLILVCMHGRALKSFMCLLLNKSISSMEEFPHTNLGLYQLEYLDGVFSLVKRNDASHLE